MTNTSTTNYHIENYYVTYTDKNVSYSSNTITVRQSLQNNIIYKLTANGGTTWSDTKPYTADTTLNVTSSATNFIITGVSVLSGTTHENATSTTSPSWVASKIEGDWVKTISVFGHNLVITCTNNPELVARTAQIKISNANNLSHYYIVNITQKAMFKPDPDTYIVQYWQNNGKSDSFSQIYYNTGNNTYYSMNDREMYKSVDLRNYVAQNLQGTLNGVYLMYESTNGKTYVVGKPDGVIAYDSTTMTTPTVIHKDNNSGSVYIKLIWEYNGVVYFADHNGQIFKVVGDSYESCGTSIPNYNEADSYRIYEWGDKFYIVRRTQNVSIVPQLIIVENGLDFKVFNIGETDCDKVYYGHDNDKIFLYTSNAEFFCYLKDGDSLIPLDNNMGNTFKPMMFFHDGTLYGINRGSTITYAYNGIEWSVCQSETYDLNGTKINDLKPSECGRYNVDFTKNNKKLVLGETDTLYEVKLIPVQK